MNCVIYCCSTLLVNQQSFLSNCFRRLNVGIYIWLLDLDTLDVLQLINSDQNTFFSLNMWMACVVMEDAGNEM